MTEESNDPKILQRALNRALHARNQAEELLESKSSELYESNHQLRKAQQELEQQVSNRTADLQRTVEELNLVAKARAKALDEYSTARDEAIRLMEERTDFFARISHDLRTPLNAIVGLTKLMLLEDHPPKLNKNLQTIDNSSRVLLSMINEILDFTKVDAGEVDVQLVPTDIVELTNSAIDMLTHEAREKDLPIYLRSRAGLPSKLLLEPTRVEQILINLLSNAVKFTSQGSITVDLDVIEKPNPSVTLRVSDTGSGIDPKRLETVFLPFKQSGEGQLITSGGTGLGLAIVDRLVRMLDGEISVESTLGEGSSFTVTIPTSAPNESKLSNSESAFSETTGSSSSNVVPKRTLESFANMGLSNPMRILVADDNQVNREALEMQLRYLGYEADYVSNGEEAIRATIERNYKLLLMDISMPVINGEEACRAIRALDDITQPLIVAVTASAMKGDKERYLEAGMDGYLAKPLDPRTLAKLLLRASEGRSLNDSSKPQNEASLPRDLVDFEDLEKRLGSMVKPMLQKIAPVFLAELQERLTKIEQAYKTKDQTLLTELMHALKGSSYSTGCIPLANLCSEAEALLRAGKQIDPNQLNRLLSCATDTGKALEDYMGHFTK